MRKKSEFIAWLRKCGAQILPNTNAYELARFVAQDQTCVVYEGRRGVSANGFAAECWEAFVAGQDVRMGSVQKPRNSMAKLKAVLLQRDGNHCFFCHECMTDGFTVEHLVGRAKGGPDHQDNLALAHESCNKSAANLPLMEKIKLRESKLHERHRLTSA